jgi:RHS repeat-associated protein
MRTSSRCFSALRSLGFAVQSFFLPQSLRQCLASLLTLVMVMSTLPASPQELSSQSGGGHWISAGLFKKELAAAGLDKALERAQPLRPIAAGVGDLRPAAVQTTEMRAAAQRHALTATPATILSSAQNGIGAAPGNVENAELALLLGNPLRDVLKPRYMFQSGAPASLAVYVGYADNVRADPNFPVPWQGSPNTTFIGTGPSFDSGAIRLDNNSNTAIEINDVFVTVPGWTTGGAFDSQGNGIADLWGSFSIPPNSSVVLAQTSAGYNFDTSDFGLTGCGNTIPDGQAPFPTVKITINGVATTFNDTGHVLDTGGFDLACRGNESLQWRLIGTSGIENNGGHVTLAPPTSIQAAGASYTATAQVTDAGNQPTANVVVNFAVLSGPNAGKTGTGTTNTQGDAVFTYTGTVPGIDILQATVTNSTGGSVQSNQVTSTWTSTNPCPPPVQPPGPTTTTLNLVGQAVGEFNDPLTLAAQLTDGNGNPLSGRSLSLTFAGQTFQATTDGNGVGTVGIAAAPAPGAVPLSVTYAGETNFKPAQLNTSINIGREETALRYTGSTLLGTAIPQAVSAVLTDPESGRPIANEAVNFRIGTIQAQAVTNAQGVASTTLTLGPNQASGPAAIQVFFAGDSSYLPSISGVQLTVYLSTSFVVWGGNAGGLHLGQDVNFWGAQWASQVTGGNFTNSNPSFKGFADPVNQVQICEASAGTGGPLDDSCWHSKPGNSFPPPLTLPAYIEVIISNAIAKQGNEIYGNIAAAAVCKVDPTPVYEPDPGHPGFCKLVAVVADGVNIFPKPPALTATQTQPATVLPAQNFNVTTTIGNSSTSTANSVVVSESFDGLTPPTATQTFASILNGAQQAATFPETTPAIPLRQSNESSVDYQTRLANIDGRLFTSTGSISFTDSIGQPFLPIAVSSFSRLEIPELTLGISGPSCVGPGSQIPYKVTVGNVGQADAKNASVLMVLPDGSNRTVTLAAIPAGGSVSTTINFVVPGIAGKQPNESDSQYLARLASIDGTQLTAIAKVNWQDAIGNGYGQIEQPFISTTERVPIITVTPQGAATLLPGQQTTVNYSVQNTGGGNASQVLLKITNPDGSVTNIPAFALQGGQATTVSSNFTVPVVAAKQAGETDAAYQARLSALDNSKLNFVGNLTWLDAAANSYGPTSPTFQSTEILPVLTVNLTGPANLSSGENSNYHLQVTNIGHANTSSFTAPVKLLDGSVVNPFPASGLTAGATAQIFVPFSVPKTQPDGQVSAVATLNWNDAGNNAYGPQSSTVVSSNTRPNQPPVVSAGPNQTITLPTNTVTLNGSVTDDGKPKGATLTIQWSQVSGPVQATFSAPNQPITTATFGTAGVYVLQLSANDTQYTTTSNVTITVNANGDLPPVVNAGPDQTINLFGVANFNGSVTDDHSPSDGPLTSSWKFVSGPGAVIFSSPSAPQTFATASATGQYVLQLSGNDTNFTTTASVNLIVNPPMIPNNNQPPVVNAGPNQTVTLPTNSVSLNGTVADDGLPVGGTLTQFWSAISAPGTVTFSNSLATSTTATFSAAGTYVLRLTASDSQLSSSADVIIKVLRTAATNSGGLFITGHDPDFHAFQGPNSAGAQHMLQDAVAYVTFNKPHPRLLLVTGLASRGGTSDPRLGLNAAGFTGYDVADDGTEGVPGVLDLHTIQFSNYDVIVVASDFGGWLRQQELDVLNARSAELINFVNAGGGMVALAEGSNSAGTSHDRFGFLPFIVTEQADDQIESGDTLTAAGLAIGLTTSDINGNASHNIFRTSGGLDIVDIDAAGDIVTLATKGRNIGTTGALNQPPVVNAGPDQTVQLPANAVTLNGTATDDGLPTGSNLAINWYQVSGPAAVVFSAPTQTVTQVTFTTAGTYVLRLIASDSQFFSTSDVHVIVKAAPQPLTVSAGPSQSITLPVNKVTMNGSASGGNGSLTLAWSTVSGPAPATFASPNSAVTQATFTLAGTYVLQLSVTDGTTTATSSATVTVSTAPLTVSAGPNQTITLPTNTVTLNGSAIGGKGPLTLTWSKLSGPASVTFASPNSAVTQATFTLAGTYVLQLSATDGTTTVPSSATVTVNPGPLTVNAGPNQTITLPTNTVTLNGSAIGGKGPLTLTWSKLSGPGSVTFTSPTSAVTQATFSTFGSYVLQLSATDGVTTVSASTTVTVNPLPIVVSAGASQTITLPTNSVTLNGSASGGAGPLTLAWSEVSGPAAVTFGSPASAVTTATFSAAGSYVLQLSATDGKTTATASTTVSVNPPPAQPPVVSAGPNQTITLPTNTATLNGSATSSNGPVTFAWSKVSGPGSVGFSSPSSAVTQASFSTAGTYVLQLSANDTKFVVNATTSVVVNPVQPPPPPPTVSINLPEGTEITSPTQITGSVSGGSWQLQYALASSDGVGPAPVFTTFASGNTPVSNGLLGTLDPTVLLNGNYIIQLVSTDQFGQTSTIASNAQVARNTKVGNFTLSFNDLSVPLPGLPITVTRTYDSRDKASHDFGFGWTVGISNVRLQKNGVLGKTWEMTESSGLIPSFCIQADKQHIVTVTFPDGRVYKFQAGTAPQCQQVAPIESANWTFTQMPGPANTQGATLQVAGDSSVLVNPPSVGPLDLLDYSTLLDSNPTVFQLTTAEGFTYVIDQTLGVTNVTDRNGNTLTINANGITSSTGKNVAFVRDSQNRITKIVDPAGSGLTYTYSSAGDLASFTDRVGNATTFSYDNNHFLTNIVNPLGVQAIKNTYDSNGRLVSTTDANGNTITYTHALASNQEAVQDRLGNTTIYTYDQDGNILQAVDALGNTTSATYDANDNELTSTDALGKTTTYTYDAVGNQTSMTDPLGHTANYTYNTRKQPLTIADALGHVTTNSYDGKGNLLSTKDALGNASAYSYATNGMPLSMTDALGKVTAFTYDGSGNPVQRTDALGNLSSFSYDANNNKLSQTVTRTKADGTKQALTTQYQYDGNGRLTKTINPDGTSAQVVYNANGQRGASIDALGRQTQYAYDNNAHLTLITYADGTKESTTYDANGNPLTSTDRAGHTASYIYDALNRPTQTRYADNSTAQTVYDAAGRTIKTIDALGNATQFAYDDVDRRVSTTDALNHLTSFIYDAAGNQLSITDALNHVTQFVYDSDNRRVQTIYPDKTTDSVGYDANGRQVSKTDQAGIITQFGYDAIGRLTSVTDALGQVTSYGYDEMGDRTSQTDANSHTTSYAYDQLGRRISRTLPLGMSEAYAYDAAGNMVSNTDFNGHTSTYTYDALNRLLSKTADPFFSAGACAGGACGATQVSYTYTATGRRASMTDGSGTTNYSYDQLDRLLSKATPFGTLAYTYDAGGNMLSLKSSNAGGGSMTYTYDALNRLASALDASGTTTYSYDVVGNLSGYSYPNGVQTSYQYDSQNRLTNLQSTCGTGVGCGSPGAPLSSYGYTLGPTGNRLSVTELNGRTVHYGYDNLYRLTSETIAGAISQNGAISYQYDAVGNRKQLNSTVPAIPATGLLNYDANDRLGTDLYDANGNTISAGAISNTYDFENHMVQRGSVNVSYDGDGNRVAETVAGTTTNYLVADANLTGYAQVVDELQSGAVTRNYTWGLELISQRPTAQGQGPSFYGFDGHGSVRFLTGSTGAVTDRYDYDAFGNLISSIGATPNNYLFAGEQFDPALGIYYNRARYYDQREGRFWSMDTWEGSIYDPASLHRYLYTANNPVTFIDRSGRELSLVGQMAVGAIIGTLTGALIGYIGGGWEGAKRGAAYGFLGGIAAPLALAVLAGGAVALGATEGAGYYFATTLMFQFAAIVGVSAYSQAKNNRQRAAAILSVVVAAIFFGFGFRNALDATVTEEPAPPEPAPSATAQTGSTAPKTLDWSIVSKSGENRFDHVRTHNSDMPMKDEHGIFFDDGVTVTNEAYARAQDLGITPKNGIYEVPMGRQVGAGGGRSGAQGFLPLNKVTIVVVPGTNKLITAYPSL